MSKPAISIGLDRLFRKRQRLLWVVHSKGNVSVQGGEAAKNLIVATAAAPSVRALRAPTTDTSSGSDLLCPIWVLPLSSHRRARRRRHGQGRAVCAFVFFPRRVEPRIQTRRPSNLWHLHRRPLGVRL